MSMIQARRTDLVTELVSHFDKPMAAPHVETNHTNAAEHVNDARRGLEELIVPAGGRPPIEWCHRAREVLLARFTRYIRENFEAIVPDRRDIHTYVDVGYFIGRDQRSGSLLITQYVDAEVSITGYLSPVRMRFYPGDRIDIPTSTLHHVLDSLHRFINSLQDLPALEAQETGEDNAH